MRRLLLNWPVALLALTITGIADDEPPVAAAGGAPSLFGHSAHGEAFNEGPRQRGVLIPGTGDVHLEVTTQSPDAQKFFDQGLGQLHGFWYFEAERSFRQVLSIDPQCAMAYWGMAMSNLNNPKRGTEFIQKGIALRDKVSKREQIWLDSLGDYFIDPKKSPRERRESLIKGMERLVFEYPDDIEAKAFLVFWIWDSADKGVPLGSKTAVDALAKAVLEKNPNHPVHHYRIHLWNGEDDRRALESAALCGQAAPAIAHMWHMPGHTFTKLKRYGDAAWQQEAAARVDHAQMIETRIMPEQIHNYAHNNDWLVEDLEYIGRVRDAWELARNMVELPRLGSRARIVGKRLSAETERSGFAMGRNRLLEIALRYELWAEITALDGTMYLSKADEAMDEVRRLRALGVAYFARGEKAKGDEFLASLEASLEDARKDRVAAADEAENLAKQTKKSPDDVARAMADALRRFSARVETTNAAIAEVRAYKALANADVTTAKDNLAGARDLSAERKARLLLQLGDKAGAEAAAREAVRSSQGQVLPLAILSDLLWRVNKKKEAVETFNQLRALAAQADLDVNVFARLAPVAREAGFQGDWRPKLETAADAGVRPPLDQLGPFRWHPYRAPDWTLQDQHGNRVSLADMRGQPLLVMFYLGSGCSHCIEQLNVFGPAAKDYAEAGIRLVAVSTDGADQLHETFAKAKDADGFPFTIVADPVMAAFKSYRAFDDFENTPLHGTFLIDAAGFVRWQDISYEPFTNAQWLLGESKRLLAMPVTWQGNTASAAPASDTAATQ